MAHVAKALPVGPFAVLTGDTHPVPTLAFVDDADAVLDPSTWAVTLNRWSPTGEQTSTVGVPTLVDVAFPWLAADTLVGGEWETTVMVNDGSAQFTLPSPRLYVYDLASMYCTVSDVEAIIGSGFDQWAIIAAIAEASAVVTAWVTRPITGTPVPLAVRRATALLAARAVTSVPGSPTSESAISSERIGDYEVRYEMSSGDDIVTITSDIRILLLPWRPSQYMGDIGEVRGSTEDTFNEGYVTL